MAYPLLDGVDRRLVGALQVDGRASPERLAAALGRRPDVPFVDIASTGEEISAFVAAGDGTRSRLLSDLTGQFADAHREPPRRGVAA